MNTELTEEDMRRALFTGSEPPAPAMNSHVQNTVPDVVIVQPVKAACYRQRRIDPATEISLIQAPTL